MKSTLIGILTMIVSIAYCFETVEYLLDKIGGQVTASVEEIPSEDDDAEKIKELSPDEFDGIHAHDFAVLHLSAHIHFSKKNLTASSAYSMEIFSPPKA